MSIMHASVSGSSPLARGLREYWCRGVGCGWIIPARAGFTVVLRRRRSWAEDHPRSRGVYIDIGPGGTSEIGSSPLARGLLKAMTQKAIESRIIPARAGFTRE